ncbi:MAG: trimethylamine methyltransferase family protein [Armatimonadia bacterium]
MNLQLFTDSQFDRLADEVRQVLREVGYHVGHPRVVGMALQAGCRQSPQGRMLFSDAQIADLTAALKEQYRDQPPAQAQDLIRPYTELRIGYGNITPKLYDCEREQAVGGTRERLEWVVKFAHAEPRITGLTIPLSRQDVPPEIEQLDSLVRMARLTDKPLGSVDVTMPEALPFVAAIGEILGRDLSAFVGCCNCVNPPLRLEYRTCETMLRRAAYHSMSMITPMPAVGGSGPVDTWGSIVLGTAEIVGGLILSQIIDPEAPLLGWVASTQVDMAGGTITSSSPQTVQVDAGVYQLMERHFGGGTRIGGRTYVTAKRPGLQAVYEKLLKAIGYAALVDHHALGYPGGGTLDNGSVTSPEQLLLDLEILEGFSHLWQAPREPEPGEVPQRLQQTILEAGGNFLTSDHTLDHYRDEAWFPRYFTRQTETQTEQQLIQQAHEQVLERVASYEPASHPEEVVKALEEVLEKAKAELLS